jgi:signal transduction histidine kinase
MAKILGDKSKSTETQVLERRVQELSTLHEIARAVTSVLDLDAVLTRIVEAGIYLTNAEEGFLLLVDKGTGDLTLRAHKGLGEKASRVLSLKVKDTIAGQVVQTGRPVRMGGFRQDQEYKVKTGYLVKSLVNVPIKSAGRVIGVLAADHSVASMRTFTDHDVVLLSSLADYAAIAIQNASLFAAASAKASALAKTLEEQTETAPQPSALDANRGLLEQLAQGLRARRDEVLRGIENTRDLARDLHTRAGDAEQVAQRLDEWNQEVLALLPQLQSLLETELSGAPPSPALSVRPPISPEAGALTITSPSDGELVEHLLEGALVSDAQGIVRQANQAAAEILDKPVSALIDSSLRNLIDDPRWERIVSSARLALAMGGAEPSAPRVLETSLCIKDDVIHAKLIPVEESRTAGSAHIVTLLRNISVESKGWRARDEALAAVSHKLRGPLTAIASYSDLLLGDSLRAADHMQRRYLQRIRQGVDRLESVLQELGEEAPSTDRRATPAPSLPVSQVINEAVDTVQTELSLDGVSISRDIGRDLPPVQLEAEYVSRIVADLLTAAGRRTGVGDDVGIRTEIQYEGGQVRHLLVNIQDGGATSQDLPPLEEDEQVCAALLLAEAAGCRIWTERRADGRHLITLLMPVAEPEPSK